MINEIREILKDDFVKVTDLPTGEHGQYDFQSGDEQALKDYQNAAGTSGMNPHNNVEFWHKLAGYVMEHKLARCHGCTAYAAWRLNGLATENNKRLLICGVGEYDHHVLLVTDNADAHSGAQIQGVAADVVVDLWQYNVTRQQSGQLDEEVLANTATNHEYTANSTIKVFAAY